MSLFVLLFFGALFSEVLSRLHLDRMIVLRPDEGCVFLKYLLFLFERMK